MANDAFTVLVLPTCLGVLEGGLMGVALLASLKAGRRLATIAARRPAREAAPSRERPLGPDAPATAAWGAES